MKRHTIQFLKYVLYVAAFSFVSVLLFTVRDSFAEAVKSDLTLTVSSSSLSVDLLPGTFGKSTNATISVTTNNFSGYNLSISMDESRNLVNGNNAIQPISSSVSEATFVSDVSYYNKWGYKPSQYITTSGTTHTVVQNTDFLPAPSLEGDLIAFTNSANSQADQYTFSFAAKVNSDIPEGDYVGTYVITAVPNPIVYNITYDDNTTDEVTGMPSPNPQVITINGGTPAAESYGVISNTIPIRSERSFGGWCDETTTEDSTTHNDVCGGTTYDAGDHFPIDQTADGSTNILYAIWLADPFPMVWSQLGACEFHGNTPSNITGTNCDAKYKNGYYIDTEVPLFNQTNYDKDFQIHLTIDHYLPSEQTGNDSQQTFINAKVPSTTTISGGTAAGLVVRRASNNISASFKMGSTSDPENINYSGITDYSVYRIDGVLYVQVNNGALVPLHDTDGFDQYFDLTTWIGAYPSTSGCDGSTAKPCSAAKRYIEAVFSNMYIKLGNFDTTGMYTVSFNGNGGTPSDASYLVPVGSALGNLPTAKRTNMALEGWYTSAEGGTLITKATIPSGNDTYHAHWIKSVAQAQIANSNIEVNEGSTATITVTNSAELEPYTFKSNDTTVATVNSSTGVITGVSAGSTTITMTGSTSGDKKTINVTVVVPTYTITFNPHNGDATSSVSVNVGDQLGTNYPANDPTYTDHIFQGWYTEDTGGTLVTSTTTPQGNDTYHAQWKGTVALANITNTQLSIREGNTDTITVTNASDIESYTLTSNDTSVATVNSSTGVVTAVTQGTTTITMEGTSSHATRTVNVTVTTQPAVKINISFNSHGGSSVNGWQIDQGDPIGTLPVAPTYADHIFQGWFTDESGGTQIDGTERPLVDTTYHAQWKGTVDLATLESDSFAIPLGDSETINVTNASDLEAYSFASANTSIATVDSSTGAITAVAKGNTTITMTGTVSGATKTISVVTADILCKLAETGTLHSGTITVNSTPTVYTYGQIAASTTPQAGDAYDCDIDNNGTYSATDERFYYLATESGSKVFVAYRSYEGSDWAVQSSSANIYNHSTAPTMLPLTSDWTHPGLLEQDTGYAARFMTYDEVNNACNVSNIGATGALLSCPYFMENTTADGHGRSAIWLQDVGTTWWRIHAGNSNRNVVSVSDTKSNNAARPAIVVPTKWVEEYVVKVNISFDSHGGSAVSGWQIDQGDPIGTLPAAPTYGDHVFQGWFTAASGGTQIDGTERPLVDTTYHAQWKGTVALANLNSSSFSIVQGGSSTLTVSNASDIEAYSLTSNDTSVATVNTSSGEITAVGVGSTTITMEGVASHATRTIDVTVVSSGVKYTISFNTHGGSGVASYDINPGETVGTLPTSTLANNVLMGWYENETGGNPITSDTMPVASTTYHAQWKLDVAQATILNPDLTLSVGGTINLNVTNGSSLEPYTLSSNNTSIATIDSAGDISGISAGTTTVVMTGTKSGLTKSFTVDVTAAPAIMHRVYFDTQGGTSVNYMEVEDGTAIGTLPTTSKSENVFFGWYTDSSLATEVTPATIIDDETTFYAKWISSTTNFPIVWYEPNECEFHGNGNSSDSPATVITGDYCGQDKTKTYVDSGIKLYDSVNYGNDYEVGFKIVSFIPQKNQETIFNAKYENSSVYYPGIMIRTNNMTNLEIAQKISNTTGQDTTGVIANVTDVRIVREGGVVKYSYNGGTLNTLQDMNGLTAQEFNTTAWFGASATSSNSPQRVSNSRITDMYIKLGTYEESTQIKIEFDARGGTASETVRYIDSGDQVGSLPTATRDGNYTFLGWYTTEDDSGELVTASRTPQGNEIYYAHWDYTSSLVPVPFDVSNNATRGYQNILSGMLPQLTQFTEDTTTIELDPSGNPKPSINFSSWGVDKTTYMTALKNNFESNSCSRPAYEDSAIDNWAAGSVDCAKPDAYNTGVGGAVNVYLFNTNESPKGASVAYARAESGYIHNMIPGKTYYWEDASDANNYGVVTATSNGGVRWIDAGQVRNVRDLGGLPVSYTDANDNTVTGTVDYGRLVRGERLWSSTDNRTAIQNLGITRQYDLATAGELKDIKFESPNYINDTVIHYNFDYGTSSYSLARKAVTDIMTDIVAGENIYFHCRVGSDRTGTVAYLLEGLLGVEDENRYEEYELSYLSGQNDRTRYYAQKANNNYYKFLFMMGYTLTKSKILEWYLAGSSNTTADMDLIQRFRTAMIVPASNNNGSGGSSGGDSGQNSSNSTNNASPLALNQSMSNSTDSTNSSSDTFTDGYTSYADPLGASQTAASSMTVSNEVAAGLAVATTAIGITCGAIAYTLGKQEVDASE